MKKSKTLIICLTVIVLAAIGAWVYVQKEKLAQKDRQAAIQRQVDEKKAAESVKKLKYQQCQLNNRQAFGDKSTFSSLRVENCDLIL